jgi:hypothetical protein
MEKNSLIYVLNSIDFFSKHAVTTNFKAAGLGVHHKLL